MLAFQQRRSDRWKRIIAIGALLAVVILMVSSSSAAWGRLKEYSPEMAADIMGILPLSKKHPLETIADRFRDTIHNVDDDHYTSSRGKDYNIAEGSHRWEKQGKKVLFLDVDSRLDTEEGAVLNRGLLDRDTIKPRTAGILNHFLYSLIHGYDYRLIRAPEATDRHGTWVKVPVIQQALNDYDMVVFLDADAVFQELNVPYEWLLRKWNVTDNTLIAMAEDPAGGRNFDSKGWVLWNTGFVTALQSERTQKLFDEWWDCPVGDKYPGCDKWAYDWAHEQRAMGEHIRYDWTVPGELGVIPCSDGNGFGKTCGGAFVAHYWTEKHRTIEDLYNALPEEYVQSLHQGFHRKKDHYFRDWSELSYPLTDVPSLL